MLQERIEERLKETGYSARYASTRVGLKPDAIRTILDGRSKSPRADRLAKIAMGLSCDVRYLLGEIDTPYTPDEQAMIDQLGAERADEWRRRKEAGDLWPRPVVAPRIRELVIRGEVAAGMWRAVEETTDEPLGMAEALLSPEYNHCKQWLERVRGPSMNRLGLVDGTLIHVIDAIDLGYELRHEDLVVAVRSRAQGSLRERSVKQVIVTEAGRFELWGRSFDDLYNTKLEFDAGLTSQEDDVTVEVIGKVIRSYQDFGRR